MYRILAFIAFLAPAHAQVAYSVCLEGTREERAICEQGNIAQDQTKALNGIAEQLRQLQVQQEFDRPLINHGL